MATPVLDSLNVKLAFLLGDPYTPTGTTVLPTEDGIAYSAFIRDLCITKGLRDFLNLYSHTALARSGFMDSYIRRMSIDASETDLPDDCAVVNGVQWYGKKALYVPLTDGRRNSVYWQNVPMYWIDFANRKLFIDNVSQFDADYTYAIYIKSVPDLQSGVSEDVLINSNQWDKVLRLAEIQARRFHQEFHAQLKTELLTDYKLEKDNGSI